ncbi:MAG: DMT family transporter [Pirellulales bacterium]|nr:DMT family transporter [Pirellulales bacterium]
MADPASPPPDVPSASAKLVGRLWILAAALLWSSCGLFVKAGLFDDWSDSVRGPLLAFWRAFFAAMVLMPAVRRPRFNVLLLPLTLCFTLMCLFYLTAITLTTAANAIWLQATSPWWVFLLSVLFFHEPMVRRDLIPLGFGVLGVGTILWFEVQGQALFGVACGVASGVTYASVVLLMRRLRRENAAWLVTLSHAVAAMAILPWVVYQDIWPSAWQLVVLACFGTFQMAVPYLCMIRGLRSISSQEAVAIALLEPVLMPLWVFLAGMESPRWWTVVGASFILVGLMLRYLVLGYAVRRRGRPLPSCSGASDSCPGDSCP